MVSTLLAIDDDADIRSLIPLVFPGPEFKVWTAASAAEGIALFAKHPPDVVLLDIHLPDLSGLETFNRLHRKDARVPVIFMTGRGTTDTAIEAIMRGAYEYLLKPLRLEQLTETVTRAVNVSRLMRVPAVIPESETVEKGSDAIIGRCDAMQAVYKAIGRVAPQNVPVLIFGESGTGKELVARAIYHYSARSKGPFLAINCAAIPETLLESELFGHEKGAFTGAERRHIGKFEQCSGGTLFLDEIGDMTPLTQTKVLRVLQDQHFERVGGNEPIRTDVRLIAATNRDLEHEITRGNFRRDLYYRLNGFTITLPPLRERKEDLPLLVHHYIRLYRRELGKEIEGVSPDVIALMEQYYWPGNVRELQSVLKQAMLQATGPYLIPEFLPASLRSLTKAPSAHEERPPFEEWHRLLRERLHAGTQNLHAEWLALTEKYLFTQVLRHTHGNLSQAGRILGIHRATLRTRLAALGIEPKHVAEEDEE